MVKADNCSVACYGHVLVNRTKCLCFAVAVNVVHSLQVKSVTYGYLVLGVDLVELAAVENNRNTRILYRLEGTVECT